MKVDDFINISFKLIDGIFNNKISVRIYSKIPYKCNTK